MNNLPASARAKLTLLGDAELDAQARVNAVYKAADSAYQRMMTSENEEDAQAYREESDRLRERLPALREQHQSLAQLNGAIRQWLHKNASVVFVAAKRSKADLGKRTPNETLSALRSEVAKLTSDRRRLAYQTFPTFEEMKAAASAWVDSLAKEGTPIIASNFQSFTVTFGKATKIESVLAWLNPDALKECLHREIEAAPKPEFTMTKQARAERLAEIEARLMELEVAEEGLIEAMTLDGIMVLRRVDASPAAILGVMRKPAAASKAA